MDTNFLKLNNEKTELLVVLFGSRQQVIANVCKTSILHLRNIMNLEITYPLQPWSAWNIYSWISYASCWGTVCFNAHCHAFCWSSTNIGILLEKRANNGNKLWCMTALGLVQLATQQTDSLLNVTCQCCKNVNGYWYYTGHRYWPSEWSLGLY